MDPLSLTASVITVIGTAGAVATTLQKLNSLRAIPAEILALSNELADFQIVLNIVSSTVQRLDKLSGENDELLRSLETLICRAEKVLKRLQYAIEKKYARSSTPGALSKTAQLTWVLKDRELTKHVQRELHSIKLGLIMLFNASQSIDIAKLNLKLEGISIAQTSSITGDIRDQFTNSSANVYLDAVSSLDDGKSNVGLHSVAQAREQLENKDTSPLRIQASPFSQLQCSTACDCACHSVSRTSIQTPDFLNELAGRWVIGWVGLFGKIPQCSRRCYRRNQQSLVVSYYFPKWFWMKRISAYIKSTLGGPELLLRVYRQVPPQAEIFNLCRVGDLDSIRSMFARGLASPYDVSAQTGSSLLPHAIRGKHFELCKFLVAEGVDIYEENFYSVRPVDDIWDVFIAMGSAGERWRITFIDEDFPDQKLFSMLHKAVTGMTGSTIAEILKHSDLDINMQDSDGRTALTLAAATNNINIVNELLASGANPNIRDRLQAPILFPSVRSAPIEITKALLNHGSDVNAKDHWGNTPLHVAAISRTDVSIAMTLLTAGAELDPQDRSGFTPLCAAVWWHNEPVARLLLDNGCKMEHRDKAGYTPLLQSVRQNAHSCTQLLLDRGANIEVYTDKGETALDLATQYGDEKMMELISKATNTLASIWTLVQGVEGEADDCFENVRI